MDAGGRGMSGLTASGRDSGKMVRTQCKDLWNVWNHDQQGEHNANVQCLKKSIRMITWRDGEHAPRTLRDRGKAHSEAVAISILAP